MIFHLYMGHDCNAARAPNKSPEPRVRPVEVKERRPQEALCRDDGFPVAGFEKFNGSRNVKHISSHSRWTLRVLATLP